MHVNIGFVYVLLNPAFPRQVKIGRTADDPQKRARQLSRQTGVPSDFIVIYEELVGNAVQVEKSLHRRFSAYRTHRNKEFFEIPPKEVIKALQELAIRFPVPAATPTLSVDLLPHFTKYFGKYLDPHVIGVQLVQLPGICYLDVTREPVEGSMPITTQEELPLRNLSTPPAPTLADLKANEALIRRLDEYDWIMISGSSLFPSDTANEIAREWEKPGGKLEQERKAQTSNSKDHVPASD